MMTDIVPLPEESNDDLEQDFLKAVSFKDKWLNDKRDYESFNQCVAILDDLLQRFPKSTETLALKGLIHYSAGNDTKNDSFYAYFYKIASECYREIVKLEPHAARASIWLFTILADAGDFYAATDEMERFLSQNPIDCQYRIIIQDFWEDFGQWQKSVKTECYPNVMRALEASPPPETQRMREPKRGIVHPHKKTT